MTTEITPLQTRGRLNCSLCLTRGVGRHWSLRSLLIKLIKIGAKVVCHSRTVTFQMAGGTSRYRLVLPPDRPPKGWGI